MTIKIINAIASAFYKGKRINLFLTPSHIEPPAPVLPETWEDARDFKWEELREYKWGDLR